MNPPIPAGYVVLCLNPSDSEWSEGWQPDWDGILYTDRADAVAELAKARRVHEARLAVVSFVEA